MWIQNNTEEQREKKKYVCGQRRRICGSQRGVAGPDKGEVEAGRRVLGSVQWRR